MEKPIDRTGAIAKPVARVLMFLVGLGIVWGAARSGFRDIPLYLAMLGGLLLPVGGLFVLTAVSPAGSKLQKASFRIAVVLTAAVFVFAMLAGAVTLLTHKTP